MQVWPLFAKVIIMLYLTMVVLVMLNLLIAKMGATYNRITERSELEWQLERARILECIEAEEGCADLEELHNLYWTKNSSGAHCFKIIHHQLSVPPSDRPAAPTAPDDDNDAPAEPLETRPSLQRLPSLASFQSFRSHQIVHSDSDSDSDSDTVVQTKKTASIRIIHDQPTSAFSFTTLLSPRSRRCISQNETIPSGGAVTRNWAGLLYKGGPSLHKFRKWMHADPSMLELRDAAGATPLHLLLLYNTAAHHELASEVPAIAVPLSTPTAQCSEGTVHVHSVGTLHSQYGHRILQFAVRALCAKCLYGVYSVCTTRAV